MSLEKLNAEVAEAETAVAKFMKAKPDLADPKTNALYVPLKKRLSEAQEALGLAIIAGKGK